MCKSATVTDVDPSGKLGRPFNTQFNITWAVGVFI